MQMCFLRFRRFLPHLFVILALSGCGTQGNIAGRTEETIVAHPTVAAPINTQSDDVIHESLDAMYEVVARHPYGFSATIRGATANRYVDWFYTFYTINAGDFIGEYVLLHGLNEAHDVAIICQLDHRQIPCHPDDTLPHITTILGGEPYFLPLQVTNLGRGHHDFDILTVLDPYYDGVDHYGDDVRMATLTIMPHANIFAGGDASQPQIDVIKVESVDREPFESIMRASLSPVLLDELGNIPVWLEAEGSAGGQLAFYLHFLVDSKSEDRDGDVIAVSAFLNYGQIPLIVNAEEHLPLFIEREADTWQILPVAIQLPLEAGVYDLLLSARTDAFERLEYKPDENGQAVGDEISRRIKLTIIQP